MGNICCNEEVKANKAEDFHLEIEKAKPYGQKFFPTNKKYLDTVKEELYEYSEHSEYQSVSRASRN
jgi:hypothetical protein